MSKLTKVILVVAVAMSLSASTLTEAEKQLLDRALSPNATKADKEAAQRLCGKCKPCFNGNECNLTCVRDRCGR